MPPKTSTKTSTSTGDPEATRIISIKDLADKVEALTAKLTSGGGGGSKTADDSRETPGTGSVEEQVNRAVQAAKEREEAKTAEEKRKQEIEDRLKGLEERTEKRPTERSKLSKFLWGEE